MTPQVAQDRSPVSTLVGCSATMRQVHRAITRIGHSRFPVLIVGETGTGKELAARAIHNMQGGTPFVTVDCASLVGALMESELFGYVKGAFTGAHNPKLGLLDAANGGTAFFDEVGELTLEMQIKLLRALQQKEFRAVGGTAQRASNFRVIAATNRDLTAEVRAKRFRQDLFYRLDVIRLRLPPLREHIEDLPALLAYFLERYGNGHKLSADVVTAMQQYNWPGNVRELEHTVQWMVAMNSGPWLTLADLPTTVVNHNREQAVMATSGESSIAGAALSSNADIMPLDDLERRAILNALECTKGSRAVVAAALGIGRTTLYRKLKAYCL